MLFACVWGDLEQVLSILRLYSNLKGSWNMIFTQKTFSFAVSLILLTIILVSSVQAQSTIGSVYVTLTSDPNVIAIAGSGFDASSPVSMGVYLRDALLAVFPDARTDETGNFAANVSVPFVGESGIYIVMANTTNVVGYQPYVFYSPGDIPDTGSGLKSLSVSPGNSNIFNVTGRGLGASKSVTLRLTQAAGATAYTFADKMTTDSQGRFSMIAIVPTSINGTYTLVASTTSGNATVQVTIPNLKGAPGQTGAPGATGATGATGETGATGAAGQADSALASPLEYASIALSIAAIAVSTYTLVKKR